jgi:hypothetical protein
MCEHCKYFDDIADDTYCVTCVPPEYSGFKRKTKADKFVGTKVNAEWAKVLQNLTYLLND